MSIRKIYNTSKYWIFPLLLILFPLVKATRGVDLTDASYSLGNYVFFRKSTGTWFLITFIANATGHLITLLPFAGTMVGMRVYTGLIISATAILGYRFFMTKMPAWLAFLAQLLAIGMCWAPSVILYNYLTYFFLFLAAGFLFRGLAGTNRSKCLIVAGIFIGINCFVRFPNNGLEVFLIFALWFYGFINKKDLGDIVKETLMCILGFAIAFVSVLVIMTLIYGSGTFLNMINGVLGMSGSASDYTLGAMILSILDAYLHGARWALYMVLCILPGIPFFVLWPGKYIKLRKVVYCICIAFLFFVLGRWGMYNFRYYQKESALQWGAVFLIISIIVCIWALLSKVMNNDWKLLSAISLIIILITPLGSNNYIWPVLNNLFFIAPVTFWIVYRFARWGRSYLDVTGKVPVFAIKAMVSAAVIMFFIQGVGIGLGYTFLDGEGGEKLDTYVTENAVLKGTKTTKETANTMASISKFMNDNADKYADKKLILYGNIPGLAYYLNKPSALNTTWSDLDSNPVGAMEEAMLSAEQEMADYEMNSSLRPLVIISTQLYAYPDDSEKFRLVSDFIVDNDYQEVFINDRFVVYE